jgi:soluble lytic murein transglycosylase
MRLIAGFLLFAACGAVCIPSLAVDGSQAAVSAPPTLSAADQQFLAARDAAIGADAARLAQLAPHLSNHPLAAYVEYWQLLPRLRSVDPAIVPAVTDFFARHADTYIADRLRLDWSLALADRGELADFERESSRLVWHTDDPQLRCYNALARYRASSNDQKDDAVREARRLLANTADSSVEGCRTLTEALLGDGRISVWERVRALVEQNQLAEAKKQGMRTLDVNGRPVDDKLLTQAIDRPATFLVAHKRQMAQVPRQLAIIAIVRLAGDNPSDAAQFAALLNPHLTPEERGVVWGRIGHMAAVRLMQEASEWYRRGDEWVGVGPDVARVDEVLEWQTRAALRIDDWNTVKATIDRMAPALRADPAWVYWYGRALKAEGLTAEAQSHFTQIAHQFNFYGKLAAEELGRPIVIPPQAPFPTPEEVLSMAANMGFARAEKFYELGLRAEGNREWNWQLRGMEDRQLLAAAEYAHTKSLLDRMINTSDRTRSEFDFTQRFPAPFRDALVQHAAPLGLDEAWVYGLIRQESRFIRDLRSHVGASGLMQLMPATAHYVARKKNVNDFAQSRVNERDLNLLLGTGYLKMVLDDLDGNQVLATAAYNAGPKRARVWRSTLARPVEGAVFAETIPFNETRDYVKKVMSNTVYYAALIVDRAQSLKARLGTISPVAAGTTELP